MALPNVLKDKLRLPVVGAPLFIISHPALVIAQCKAGIVGAFLALNARPISQLDEWLHEITEALAAHERAHPESPAAPRSPSSRSCINPMCGSKRIWR
jgi:nitronate monooxygenase